jgi:PAS domain-containing protein
MMARESGLSSWPMKWTGHTALSELAPVGFIRLNDQGVICDANLFTVILLGAARVTLLRQPLVRFIFHEDWEIYYLHRQQLLTMGTMQRCDVRMVKRDGSLFEARLEATAALSPKGAPEYRALLSAVGDRPLRHHGAFLDKADQVPMF